MKLNRREFVLVVVYLIIICGAGGYYFFFQFGYPRYKEVNSKIKDMETALIKINTILESKELVEKEYNVFEKKFSVKENRETRSTDILQAIKAKVGDAGLNVINIKPLAVKKEGLYDEFEVKVETEGELKNFGKFLYALDDSPYVFAVKYTQIAAQAQGEPLKIQLLLSAATAKE